MDEATIISAMTGDVITFVKSDAKGFENETFERSVSLDMDLGANLVVPSRVVVVFGKNY